MLELIKLISLLQLSMFYTIILINNKTVCRQSFFIIVIILFKLNILLNKTNNNIIAQFVKPHQSTFLTNDYNNIIMIPVIYTGRNNGDSKKKYPVESVSYINFYMQLLLYYIILRN